MNRLKLLHIKSEKQHRELSVKIEKAISRSRQAMVRQYGLEKALEIEEKVNKNLNERYTK
jgi:hypothetical protein